MDPQLRALLDDLYADGVRYDADRSDRLLRRRNLEPDAAAFLWLFVQATATRTMVEIGTSNGYSTIWFADALRRTGGRLVSVDTDPVTQREAAENLRRAGVADVVELRAADGGGYLSTVPAGSLDVLFLDAERPEYPGWWDAVRRALRPGGTLIVDNALSHPDEVAPFRRLVEAEPGYACTLVDVGKGEFLAVTAGQV